MLRRHGNLHLIVHLLAQVEPFAAVIKPASPGHVTMWINAVILSTSRFVAALMNVRL
jgi:hypothetical protein